MRVGAVQQLLRENGLRLPPAAASGNAQKVGSHVHVLHRRPEISESPSSSASWPDLHPPWAQGMGREGPKEAGGFPTKSLSPTLKECV